MSERLTPSQDTASTGAFPATRLTVVQQAIGPAPERAQALETLAAAYWKPVYKYLRLRWRLAPEAAEDLTQEFFVELLHRDGLRRFDPARGRFRTWLRIVADGLAGHALRAADRLKRGGRATVLRLDFQDAEGELLRLEPAAQGKPDELFEREWLRALFGGAVDALRARCAADGRALHFELFRRYDLEPSPERATYAALASEHGLSETQVLNHLAWVRAEFRREARARLRELSRSAEEFREDARRLFGAAPDEPPPGHAHGP
jgi:RNA polymerase sigma factor (sigma-70 family)